MIVFTVWWYAMLLVFIHVPGINGGRIVGQQQRVSRATLFQDRDFPVLNDYRAVFGGLFRSMWGLSAKQSGQIFQQVEPAGLGLI